MDVNWSLLGYCVLGRATERHSLELQSIISKIQLNRASSRLGAVCFRYLLMRFAYITFWILECDNSWGGTLRALWIGMVLLALYFGHGEIFDWVKYNSFLNTIKMVEMPCGIV